MARRFAGLSFSARALPPPAIQLSSSRFDRIGVVLALWFATGNPLLGKSTGTVRLAVAIWPGVVP